MYRCVKIKVEIGRQWGKTADKFNSQAMKQLKQLSGVPDSPVTSSSASAKDKKRVNITECCICLFSVTARQALFVAPCGHVFHYKCLRMLLNQHHPGFICPLCREYWDLNADVDTEDAPETASRRHSAISRRDSAGTGSDRHEEGADDAREPLTTSGPSPGDQNTAVVPESTTFQTIVPEVPAVIDEEGEGVTTPAGNSMNIPSRRINGGAVFVDDLNCQTPMNETFLSTLAENLSTSLDISGDRNPPLSPPDEGLEMRDPDSGGSSEEGRRGDDLEEPMFQ